MKLGISSYCLDREIEQGRMTLAEAIDWAAAQGAQCMELVPFAFRFDDPATGKIDTQAITQVKKQARDAGVELCNYSVLADLCREGEAQRAEIDRLKHEIDIAAELGLPRMRHDVCAFRRPQGQNTPRDFERMLPRMAEAARDRGATVIAAGSDVTDHPKLYFDHGVQAALGRGRPQPLAPLCLPPLRPPAHRAPRRLGKHPAWL